MQFQILNSFPQDLVYKVCNQKIINICENYNFAFSLSHSVETTQFQRVLPLAELEVNTTAVIG